MYITDRDKLHRRWIILVLYAAILLIVMLLCLHHIDTVGKMQLDTLNQIVEVRHELDVVATAVTELPESVSLGEFKITHYCPCAKCCGKTDGITYTGTTATAGRTIGVDPDVIPLGSTVLIDGHAYTAEDTGGGIQGKRIDMFVEDHQEALELGVKFEEVILKCK